MKFGKTLAKRQLDIPEYAASFVNYKALKKLIKHLGVGVKPPAPPVPSQSPSGPSFNDPQAALQANRATFFFRLERELEKVNTFYLQKEEELKLRLKTLTDKKKIMQSRSQTTSKISATYITLQEGFQQFENDLNKLQQFVEINATAFSKILKKWDKSSKSRTKELYLSRAVEVQPCFNRDVITELSDQATTSLLELEAWAEGENITFDSKDSEQSTDDRLLGSGGGDEDTELLKAVFSENSTALKEWINRLKSSENPQQAVTRTFLAAIAEGSEESLGVLMDSGMVNFHHEDEINERNCLHEAANTKRLSVLSELLKRGVDPSRVDVYGRIPLHYAAMHGHVEMVQLLVNVQPPTIDAVDHDNFTPLIHAITHNQQEVVRQLIDCNARVDPRDEKDYIPLNLACQHGYCEISEILLQHKARILPDAEGLYPQHLVARSGKSVQLLMTLKQYGANPNELDKLFQWAAVFHAASEGHVECLKALLESGARADLIDEKGLSAMYYAAWEGHLECMQLLSAAGGALGGLGTAAPMRPSPASIASTVSGTQMTIDSDGIPDLSLPPPILPLRRYGHNFLENKTFVQLAFDETDSKPIAFYHEGKHPAARLTISSKSSDLIPRNILLPLNEDAKIVSFQIDTLDMFTIDFDIYPTFGSKVIARTVALPNTFSSRSSGHCVLPLFDSRLRAIGQISFNFQIINPFQGVPLEITHFATYWKATNQFDSHPNALITGSSLAGEYVRLCIQLTSDGVPVVYPSWSIPFSGLEVPVCSVTHAQFQKIGAQAGSEEAQQRLPNIQSLAELHFLLAYSFLTLQRVLSLLPVDVHLDLNIIYPTCAEKRQLGLGGAMNANSSVDAVLTVVFDHARTLKQASPDLTRSIVFSSFNSNVCTALNWKQPNYPVFYCNDLGKEPNDDLQGTASCTRSRTSLKEAVRFASSNNLMGIICSSRLMEMVPALAQSVKVAGLVLVAHTANDPSLSIVSCVDGVLSKEGVLKFEETIDM
ncbi:ankyrin repeat protein nuc-2 [Tuber indicum]|nr:ankyrin repeat protein nuc-2 [Tuber indicum]